MFVKENKQVKYDFLKRICLMFFVFFSAILISLAFYYLEFSNPPQEAKAIFIFFLFLSLLSGIILFFLQKKHIASLQNLDPITGIASWKKMQDVVNQRLTVAQSGDFVFVAVDIDRFQMMKENFGIDESNKIISILGNVLSSFVKSGEYASHITNDVFGLLIKNTGFQNLLERLNECNDTIVSSLNKNTLAFSVSLSWGVYVIDDTTILPSLISDRALIAMRSEKERFDSTYVFYSNIMLEKLLFRNRIETSMQGALASGEFLLFLQPKYNFADNSLCGAEALVRWHSHEYGNIMPDDFIPLFEKNGFVNRVDLYVYEQVCKAINLQIKAGLKPVPVSFNLSRLHLLDPEIVEKLVEVRELYNIPPHLVEVELTEGAFNANNHSFTDTLIKLREKGFAIAIDDFGSGYSSLNLLSHIPVDIVKLDKAFLSESAETDRGRIVLSSVISMAKNLNLHIVCEGVETEEQAQFLRKNECDTAQGFLFSRPITEESFNALLSVDTSFVPKEEETYNAIEEIEELEELEEVDNN